MGSLSSLYFGSIESGQEEEVVVSYPASEASLYC